ncbi:hypothetical protein V1527DRAFT_452411 [Lipomyces starkeyi]
MHASMDRYLEHRPTRRANAEEVDSTDEVFYIDEPIKFIDDPNVSRTVYSFSEKPLVELDLPSSQTTHPYVPSSQPPTSDEAPRSCSPFADSSSMELDNAVAGRFAAVRTSLDSIDCDCGGLRKAQLAHSILLGDHHHLVDPLIVTDDEDTMVLHGAQVIISIIQ